MGSQRGIDRRTVVTTACDLADAHGFASVTMALVAAELGVRSQSLYAHVDNLDDLRRAVALAGLDQLAQDLGDSVMALTGTDALRALCRRYLEFATSHPGVYDACTSAPGEDEALRTADERVGRPFRAVLASFDITGDDAEHLHRIIWTSMFGFATARNKGIMAWSIDPEETFERMIQMFEAAVVARVGASPR